MNDAVNHFLLSLYLDYTFQSRLLMKIDRESLQTIYEELDSRFEDMKLTIDDAKAAWKCWFDLAANDGTIVSIDFTIKDYEVAHKHPALSVIDLVIKLACEYIDKL